MEALFFLESELAGQGVNPKIQPCPGASQSSSGKERRLFIDKTSILSPIAQNGRMILNRAKKGLPSSGETGPFAITSWG